MHEASRKPRRLEEKKQKKEVTSSAASAAVSLALRSLSSAFRDN